MGQDFSIAYGAERGLGKMRGRRAWLLERYTGCGSAFDGMSDRTGSVVEGLSRGKLPIAVGESEAEAVVVIARNEVDVEVECLLPGGLSIGDNPVDAIASQSLVESPRDPVCDCEEPGGDRVVQVGDARCVGCGNEQGVAVVDRLDVQERHYGVIPIYPACGEFAVVDFAEDTRGVHLP